MIDKWLQSWIQERWIQESAEIERKVIKTHKGTLI